MKIVNKYKNQFAVSMAALVIFVLFCMILSSSAGAAPLQGMYDNCNIKSGSCLGHLDKMGDGGFGLVLNYGSGSSGNSPEEMEAYLDRAQKNGMRVIWDFNELAGKSNAADTVARVVEEVKDHPATWGYCIADEASAGQSGSVGKMSDAVKAIDSGHPVFVMGTYNTGSLGSFVSAADVLGLFIYPIGESEDSEKMVAEVGSVAKSLRQYGTSRGKRTIIALQAFNWADQGDAPDWSNKRWPTRSEMRQMRNQASAYGPEAILWFSYWHAARSSSHWSDVVWAANGG